MSAIGLLLMAAMLWGGGQGLVTALANMEPAPMTCDELAKGKPKASWLRLTDCEVDLAHGGYEGVKDPRVLYLPLRAPGAPETEPSRVVLETADPGLISIVRGLSLVAGGSPLVPEGTQVSIDELARTKRSFDGLILFGIELSDSKRKNVKEVVETVVDDFVIMKHGETPKPLFSGLMFMGGLALLGVFVHRFRKAKATAPPRNAP